MPYNRSTFNALNKKEIIQAPNSCPTNIRILHYYFQFTLFRLLSFLLSFLLPHFFLHYITSFQHIFSWRFEFFPISDRNFPYPLNIRKHSTEKIIYRGKKNTHVLVFITSRSSMLTSPFISRLSVICDRSELMYFSSLL